MVNIEESVIAKYAMLMMLNEKREAVEGIELCKQECTGMFREKEIYRCLRILEVDTIKQIKMKEKIRKEYLRRMKKTFEINLSSRNLIKGINNWVLSLVIYSESFLDWSKEKLRNMNHSARK